MRIIITIFIAVVLSGCNGCNDNPVTPPRPIDTVVVPPKDTVVLPPVDTIIIIEPDTILPPPILPPVEIQPFTINTDIESDAVNDLIDVLNGYKEGRVITIKKVLLENRTGQAFYISANKKDVVLKYTTQQSLECPER